MTKMVYLKLAGMDLEVEVYYEDNAVCEVESVCVKGTPIEVNKKEFFKALEGELQDALEDAIRDERIAYEEMKYDEMKEEGLI